MPNNKKKLETALKRLNQSRGAVATIEAEPSDREWIFQSIVNLYRTKTVYYFNKGFDSLQILELEEKKRGETTLIRLKYRGTDIKITDPLQYLLSNEELQQQNSTFILNLNFSSLSQIEIERQELQIENLFSKYYDTKVKIIFITKINQLSASVRVALTEDIKINLPEEKEIYGILQRNLAVEPSGALIAAAKALSRGEIIGYLKKTKEAEALAKSFLQFKTNKLQNLEVPLEYFSEITIDKIAGSENLVEYLFSKLARLLEVEAKEYKIETPRAMMYVGPPGTGKSLMAKQVAESFNYSLIGLSFGNILSCENPELAINRVLEIAEVLDTVILFLDDFDKGFSNWEEGGSSRRIAQKFLTWMQEHSSRVITIATCNRIELLPAELIRRFDSGGIWLIDIPSRGDIFEITMIYLRKYFPQQFSSQCVVSREEYEYLDTELKKKARRGRGEEEKYYIFETPQINPFTYREWEKIIIEAEGCTPVELEDAVKTCIQDWYCQTPKDTLGNMEVIPKVTPRKLLGVISSINKASVRADEEFQAMRNNAHFAKPAAGKDLSVFALETDVPLMGNKY